MSVFKKGAGLLRVVYKSNLKTAPKKVSVIGKYYPFNDGLDAYQWFEVEGLPATPTEKEFLEGNPNRLSYYVPSDITDIISPLGLLFPNCTVYVVGNTEQVVSGLPDANATAIVPNTLKSSYLADPVYSTYQNLTFDSWILQNETTIPFVGNTTLTASFVRLFYENAGGIASTVGKIIVAPEYTDYETGVFDLIFALFVNCEEIEYGDIKVPAEYQEVEYIESTGSQKINSAYVLQSSNLKIETKIYVASMPSSEQRVVDNISTDSKRFGLAMYSGYVFGFNAGNSSVNSASYSGAQTLEISMLYDYASAIKTLEVNGLATSSTYNKEINSSQSISLFGTDTGSRFAGRMYYCRLFDNGTLVRDFVPCYRKSDDVIGLYDTINDVFYTNQGSGVFLKGADVNHIANRPALATATIVGSGTLTAQKVADTLTAYPEFASAERVIVPVEFTEYESGSIQAIQNAFSNIRYLKTCYEGGDIELDLQGDIVAKILSLNKTLDEALVYARTTSVSDLTNDNSNIVIIPPLVHNGFISVRTLPNLVYIPSLTATRFDSSFWNSPIVEMHIKYTSTYESLYVTPCYLDSTLKRLYIDFTAGKPSRLMMTARDCCGNIERIIFKGATAVNNSSAYFNLYSTKLTREAIVEFFDNLGQADASGITYGWTTILLGPTNLAKLTAEDIAIATNKGWVVQ